MSAVTPLLKDADIEDAAPPQPPPPPPVTCFTGCNRESLTLFATRTFRMFGYGAIAPVFFLYMVSLGFSTTKTCGGFMLPPYGRPSPDRHNVVPSIYCRGALMTMILVGDLFITLYLTTRADRFLGRRNVMITGALLKVRLRCLTLQARCSRRVDTPHRSSPASSLHLRATSGGCSLLAS